MEVIPYTAMDPVGSVAFHLFSGCCLEADRADTIVFHLEKLRSGVTGNTQHLTATIEEIRANGGHLRELVDFAQVHRDRVPTLLNFLNILLPCLSRSLRDILFYCVDRSATKKNRWRKMYHHLTAESDGLPLPQRFTLYNYFLKSIRDVLIRSSSFDLNGLENARTKILQLREKRNIPPPPGDVGPQMRSAVLSFEVEPVTHWAEQIFSLPLPSRTAMRNQQQSISAGPHQLWGSFWIAENSRILFRRTFNDDRISLTAFEDGYDQSPYLLLRALDPETGSAWFSRRGAHELCVEREGSCLVLKRWSRKDVCIKTWAILNFVTWEELVLTFCTFVVLKARNDMTVEMPPDDYVLGSERMLFHARISDDGFWHSLIVYKDVLSGGIRLHAAVWEGELRSCPVWTAFVTHQSSSPTWLKRVSRRRIRLADIQLYVFCQNYRQQTQRRGNAGAFEISFHSEESCNRFKDLFPRLLTQGKVSKRF
ncbi:unnamed protein product [Clonostachys rosea]|uniref:Uncharacterized protein n=1 Tax=Bionectria ochroleuca TaxID=29856 RepID=A0ABY6TQ96_BIOOC|nr:unnamed protein product [Clonostachys rosea]